MLSAIPYAIREEITERLKTNLKNFSFCSGGCINNGGRLETSYGFFFLKWNDAGKFPGMFEAEAKGLKLLAAQDVIHVPKVIACAQTHLFQFLVLEFIKEKSQSGSYWKNLGQQLASLHKKSSSVFGLDHDNYIGSLRQINSPEENWIDFFINQRLEIQLQLASEKGKINKEVIRQFQILYKKLPELLPDEKPSLLHGDLWSGNLITDASGEPCLIDPAVYYGNREAEIALTTLFGGFSQEFYKSYAENFPFFPGYIDRLEVYNLYPLMVHVNLFGGGYLSQVVSILRRIV